MRIAICDNQSEDLNAVCALLRAYRTAHPSLPLEIRSFSSGTELLASLSQEAPFSLYLLDVLMPDMSGIALAGQLCCHERNPYIIFLTTSAEYAIDAFAVHAKNYLLKPLQPARFFAVLGEAVAALAAATQPFTIAGTAGRSFTLPMSSILYAECAAHTVRYHLEGGETLPGRTLRVPFAEAIAPLLASGFFFQPHHSYLVNAEKIARLSGSAITLTCGDTLPISRLRLADAKRFYMDFLSRRGLPEAEAWDGQRNV